MTERGEAKGKRQIGARVDDTLLKEVRILAICVGRRFNDMLEEAIRDLLKKYKAKTKGK